MDFSKVRILNMHEYIGLGKDYPQDFYNFMNKHLYEHVNVDYSRTYEPDVLKDDLEAEATINDNVKFLETSVWFLRLF